MKLLSSIIISITMILPISSQEQTFSYEQLVAQDIGKQVLCMAKTFTMKLQWNHMKVN
jgi:hypothetical protein